MRGSDVESLDLTPVAEDLGVEEPSEGAGGKNPALARALALGVVIQAAIVMVLALIVVFEAGAPPEAVITLSSAEVEEVAPERPEIQEPSRHMPSRSSAAAIPTLAVAAPTDFAIPLGIDETALENPLGGMGDGLGNALSGLLGGGGGGIGKGFFGLMTDVSRIVYVVDVSGSMSGGRDGPASYFRVEDELVNALQAHPPTTFVNVIVFGSDTKGYRRQLVPAEPKNISSMVRWAKQRGPVRRVESKNGPGWERSDDGIHGGTRADLGLIEAFRDEPDVIVFLSDGSPTGVSENEIHDLVAKFQEKREKPVPIHTISYRSNSGQAFMEKLAADSGGDFKQVD
ncbi:hypothetical protein BH23VER1_BH23VER1_08550 [soil metagenome]